MTFNKTGANSLLCPINFSPSRVWPPSIETIRLFLSRVGVRAKVSVNIMVRMLGLGFRPNDGARFEVMIRV